MEKPIVIKVRDELTYNQFGCEPGYFENFIKDRHLEVIESRENPGFVRVRDSEGEEWTVYKENFIVVNQLSLF